MGEEQQAKRGRGRPALPEGEGKRYPLNMRTTKDLRDSIKRASELNGRSIAQEAEFRLERSLIAEQSVAELMAVMFGRQPVMKLMMVLARVVERVERATGKPIEADWASYQGAKQGIIEMLDRLAPSASDAERQEALRGASLLMPEPGDFSPYMLALSAGYDAANAEASRLQDLVNGKAQSKRREG